LALTVKYLIQSMLPRELYMKCQLSCFKLGGQAQRWQSRCSGLYCAMVDVTFESKAIMAVIEPCQFCLEAFEAF